MLLHEIYLFVLKLTMYQEVWGATVTALGTSHGAAKTYPKIWYRSNLEFFNGFGICIFYTIFFVKQNKYPKNSRNVTISRIF